MSNTNDFFPENKAEAALRESQEMEANSNSLAEDQVKELKSMSRLLEKLQMASTESTNLQKPSTTGNVELLKAIKSIEEKEAFSNSNIDLTFSDQGQVSLDMMKDIAKASLDADQQEQKILKDELKAIQEFIGASITNKDESKTLLEIHKSIDSGVKANSTVLAKFTEGLHKGLTNTLMPAVVGTIATVFSDSPIFGIAAGLIGEGAKRAFEKRRENIKERRDRARFRLEKLSAEHTKRLLELQESKADIKEDVLPERKEEITESKVNIDELSSAIAEEFDLNFQDIVDEISMGLQRKFEEAGIDLNSINPEVPSDTIDPIITKENADQNIDTGLFTLGDISNQLESIRLEIEKGNIFNKRGTEERRREGAIQRDELISAIEGLKGSGVDGLKDDKEFSSLMDKLDFLGLGGIFATVGVILSKLAAGGKSLFKIAKRVLAPVAAIVASFRGISSAMDEFEKSGSLLKGIAVGVQSTGSAIVEIFTFGLLDAEKAGNFLREVIPTKVSDAIFRTVDWMVELFNSPLETLKNAGEGLVDILTSAIMSPIYAIKNFFSETDFSNVKQFMSNMSETVYEWIASVIPDFVPNAVIPDSILKYKDSSVAAEVKQEEFEELQNQVGNSNTITPQMILELQRAREAMQLAQIQAIREKIYEDGDIRDTSDPRVQELNTLKTQILNTRESIGKIETRIERVNNPTPSNEVGTIEALNKKNPIFATKTDKVMLGERIQEKKAQIESMARDKQSAASNTNIATNQSIVNNSSTTHITKDVFNSDPSIMRPVFN